ncbi:extracellular solute-binding protein [Proteinivorax hydrogeniformans]|uniref:Extracellular solute-binding protein n=1 Tax=Proteinivorax hydrogeniformans TaxID=1826727 RepID=A0AAU8HV17_9FIRM
MKIYKATVLVLVLSFLVVGCQSPLPDPVDPDTEITLEIWETYGEEERKVFLEIVDKFEKKHPNITIEAKNIKRGQKWGELQKGLATGDLPDIAKVDMEYVPTLAEARAIINLNYLGIDEEGDKYLKSAFESNRYQGRIYGVPKRVDTSVLIYNKSLFDKADLSYPLSSWDYEDFIEASLALTDSDVYGFAMSSRLEGVLPILLSHGASLTDEKSKEFTLNTEKAIEGLSLITSLHKEHATMEGAWLSDVTSSREGFIQQQYAMIIDCTDSLSRYEDEDLDFGVSTIPAGTSGAISSIKGNSMVILEDSSYPHEAYKFIKFLTSEEIQVFWAEKLGQIPVNSKAVSTINTDDNPILEVMLKQAEQTVPRPAILGYSRMEELVSREIKAALKGDKSPSKAIQDASDRVNEELFTE